MYIRKTVDVWRFYVNYGGGWEYELCEYNQQEIKQREKEYAENCPQYPVKVVKGRERIDRYYKYVLTTEAQGCRRPLCGLLKEDPDPTGKHSLVYVYGRPLYQQEEQEYGLVEIGTEEVA